MTYFPNYQSLDKYFLTVIRSGSLDHRSVTGADNGYNGPIGNYPINKVQPAILIEGSSSWYSGDLQEKNKGIPDLKDLTIVSTAEIGNEKVIPDGKINAKFGVGSGPTIRFVLKNKLAQDYILSDLTGEKTPEACWDHGSLMISRNDNSKPSILLQMNKDIDLPNGVGEKGFVIIPENLHPGS